VDILLRDSGRGQTFFKADRAQTRRVDIPILAYQTVAKWDGPDETVSGKACEEAVEIWP
jgi:hypothetical protein